MVRRSPSTEDRKDDERGFRAKVRWEPPLKVVTMSGDLDRCSCEAAVRACTRSDELGQDAVVDVVVDPASLEFMDCAGYSALVESSAMLRRRGGSLSVRGAVGEPLRLLDLLEHSSPGRALRSDGPADPGTS